MFQILLEVTVAAAVYLSVSVRTFDTLEECERARLSDADDGISESSVGRKLAAQGLRVQSLATECIKIADPS